MARQYPRFLFSDPQNTRSKGPFVIHTLDPRLLFKLTKDEDEWEQAEFGSGFDPGTGNEDDYYYMILLDKEPQDKELNALYGEVLKQAIEWTKQQIISRQIRL